MGTVSISGKTYDIYGELTSDAGSFVSATTYFTGQLNTTAWDAAGQTDKSKSLVTATRILDKQPWAGTPTDVVTPQVLAWPRTGASDRDGNAILTTITPDEVIFANYELAASILADATLQSASTSGSNTRRVLSRKKVGDLEIEDETEYFIPTIIGPSASGRFPAIVQEYLRGLIGGDGILSSVSGSTASSFLAADHCTTDPSS